MTQDFFQLVYNQCFILGVLLFYLLGVQLGGPNPLFCAVNKANYPLQASGFLGISV